MRHLCLALLVGWLTSCQTVHYYRQAIHGQLEIQSKARPIAEVKTDAKTSRELKRKLELIEELRAFAQKELRLPVKDQYSTYADLQRPFVVWVVFAAPEFSTEGKTWWYPFVGAQKYHGYFSKDEALAEVKRLKAQGYDVFGGGVEAYSTLGVFRDPVMNTFIERSDVKLAELIFHELSHPRVFFSGDTDFNEAFATANSEEAVRRWLKAKPNAKALAEYDEELQHDAQFTKLVLSTREKLKALYKNKALTVEAMRSEKQHLLTQMRRQYESLKRGWHGDTTHDAWFAKPLNNARLNAVASYYDLVPGFHALLKRQRGDLEKFYEAAEALKPLSNEDRRRRLPEGEGS